VIEEVSNLGRSLEHSRVARLAAIAALALLAILPASCATTPAPPTATPSPEPTVTPSGPLVLDPAAPDLPEGALSLGRCATAVTGVAWSPNGAWLAWPRDEGAAIVDVPTGLQVRSLAGHGAAALSIAWSPDGSRVATGGEDSAVLIWDATSGEQLDALQADGPVLAVVWSPDGNRLATVASLPGSSPEQPLAQVAVWDVAGAARSFTLEGYLPAVTWFPDGTRLLAATPEETVVVDAGAGEVLGPVGQSEWAAETYDPQWAGVLSPDGTLYLRTFIQAHGTGSTVEAVSVESGEVTFSQEARYATIGLWAWSPDGTRIAMGGPNVVILRDGTTGRQLAMLTAGMEDVTALAWSPDSTLVATGSSNGTVVVWSVGE
jgi:WD40 repeat protein